MRFQLRPLPRPARSVVAALLLAFPASGPAQRYDSMSAAAVQRRLENYTNDLVNELRSRRNTPHTPSTANIQGSSWAEMLRARDAEKKAAREEWLEQRRRDAEWTRDHPGETREAYYSRLQGERGARLAEEYRRVVERAAAQRAEFIAAQKARLERAQWAEYRSSVNGYASRERPPVFKSGPEAIRWLVSHDREQPNQWAAVQAALLLADGSHELQRDPAEAARLVDPRRVSSRPADDPLRPESLALHAYLRLRHPEIFAADPALSNVADARRELEKHAETSSQAQWLLARVLADSADRGDQERALVLLAPGYEWAVAEYAPFFGDNAPLRHATLQHLNAILVGILERHRALFPAAQRQWSDDQFQFLTNAVASSKLASTDLLFTYTDVIAERAIPASPELPFDNLHFGEVIAAAGRAGSGTAHALATLDRFSLLHTGRPPGPYQRAYGTLADMSLAIPTLTTWSRRDDTIGIRARLALAQLADPTARAADYVLPDSPEGQAWNSARTAALSSEYRDSQQAQQDRTFVRPSKATQAAQARLAAAKAAALAAFEDRERSAPPVGAVPQLLANLEAARAWESDLAALQPALTGEMSLPFAVDDPLFDLAKAAALLDAAFSPMIPAGPIRNRYLYAAAQLGDAYAPYALSLQPSYPIEPSVGIALREISFKRRARDEARGDPRALLAKAIDARLRSQNAISLLAAAAKAGSPLAAALQLDQRIGNEMARENDRPPSWNLPPAKIADLDAAVMTLRAEPEAFAEWSIVQSLATAPEVQSAARRWFAYLAMWDQDRQERLADEALVLAIQPQVDAVLATLAEWPGINQSDPLRAEWTSAAEHDRELAQQAIQADDGATALFHFLAAAGRGDRGALELLGRHVRAGRGGLPRSSHLADQIQAVSLGMTMTDAEVGDAFAANYVGQCFREGRFGAEADAAKATEWLRYAASIGSANAARTLATPDSTGLTRPASEILYWATVRDALEQGRHLLQPPRRLPGELLETTPVHALLETAATKFSTFRNKKPTERSDAAMERHYARVEAAQNELKKNPLKGLVLLADLAAEDDRYCAQDVARILATGEYGLQPAPALARRFLQTVVGDLERTAEYGNEADAHHVACRALVGLDGPPDTATGLRWLTYAAERGSYISAELLGQIFAEGLVPGLAPNPSEAARWNAIAEKISDETYKPRNPLKR